MPAFVHFYGSHKKEKQKREGELKLKSFFLIPCLFSIFSYINRFLLIYLLIYLFQHYWLMMQHDVITSNVHFVHNCPDGMNIFPFFLGFSRSHVPDCYGSVAK